MAEHVSSTRKRRNPITRIVTLLALIACVVAVLFIVKNTKSNDSSSADQQLQAQQQAKKQRKARPKEYTVQDGDSFGAIAVKFNMPVKRLAALNPDIDPQSLNAGQILKLKDRK